MLLEISHWLPILISGEGEISTDGARNLGNSDFLQESFPDDG
jgi:hypothetical protein